MYNNNYNNNYNYYHSGQRMEQQRFVSEKEDFKKDELEVELKQEEDKIK